jgi:23S rRNA pseudouridine2605 synthase
MSRIAKFIAASGICSRRDAEILIHQGRVSIDGITITSPAINITSDNIVKLDGKLIKAPDRVRLWAYYKPQGLITTHKDTHNRDTVFENLHDLPRVISIGRLDINSEGLLLLTNNGDLARKFELPSNNIERTYKCRAFGNYKSLLSYQNKIVTINNIKYSFKSIKLIESSKISMNNWFEIVLTEGKNREVRKIFDYFKLDVNRLIRIKYGNFELGNLAVGEYREIINF